MDGPIDPIEGIEPYRGSEEARGPEQPTYRRTLRGEVIAVRKRTGHRPDGHLLDATVGEQQHDEIVVRITRGDVDDVSGKHVVIQLER
jgi:hypothetical protein